MFSYFLSFFSNQQQSQPKDEEFCIVEQVVEIKKTNTPEPEQELVNKLATGQFNKSLSDLSSSSETLDLADEKSLNTENYKKKSKKRKGKKDSKKDSKK